MKLGLQILLSCLRSTTDQGGDRIAEEVFAHVVFMAEPYGSPTPAAFKQFILFVFGRLQDAVSDPTLPEYLHGRYCALVYLIMHHFVELQQKLRMGGTVPNHVLPALEVLCEIDDCNDVRIIFRLLEVSMHTSDTITFEDVFDVEDEFGPEDEEEDSVNPNNPIQSVDTTSSAMHTMSSSDSTSHLEDHRGINNTTSATTATPYPDLLTGRSGTWKNSPARSRSRSPPSTGPDGNVSRLPTTTSISGNNSNNRSTSPADPLRVPSPTALPFPPLSVPIEDSPSAENLSDEDSVHGLDSMLAHAQIEMTHESLVMSSSHSDGDMQHVSGNAQAEAIEIKKKLQQQLQRDQMVHTLSNSSALTDGGDIADSATVLESMTISDPFDAMSPSSIVSTFTFGSSTVKSSSELVENESVGDENKEDEVVGKGEVAKANTSSSVTYRQNEKGKIVDRESVRNKALRSWVKVRDQFFDFDFIDVFVSNFLFSILTISNKYD